MSDGDRLALDALAKDAKLAILSDKLLRVPTLPALLGGRPLVDANDRDAAAYVGWGNRPSGRLARARAEARQRPFVLLEDAFLRSVGLGKAGAAAVGFVLDDRGVYYDASRESRLEAIIAASGEGAPGEASADLALWRAERLSKYNLGQDRAPLALRGREDWVILVDQVAGDESIAGAGAEAATFSRLLTSALAEYPAARLAVRVHPDVAHGRAKGYLAQAARQLGLPIIADDVSPHAILDIAAAVWTVSSALGFEALLRGVETTVFGAPFYAGWGLTRERAQGPVWQAALARRGRPRTIETLFAAAFARYPRYVDPVTRKPLDFRAAVERIVDWRRRDRAQAGLTTYAFGFSPWKRRACAVALGGTGSSVIFAGRPNALWARRVKAGPGVRAAVWGSRGSQRFLETCRERGAPIVRVEDGFVRSVGLGSSLLSPGSLIVDDLGLYYDARSASRLEVLIGETAFDAALLERAAALRRKIVEQAITKYNLGAAVVDLRALAGGRRVALIAEQVPNDAAIRFGGGDIEPNLGLLRAVRQADPRLFIAYKEHPDLVAGNRRGRSQRKALEAEADCLVTGGDIAGLFACADELHVISSLAGFEALLRGLEVHVWGRPFYAGWGLTRDRRPIERRGRAISLDALVAATLILYPFYLDPISLVPCSVEDFLESIAYLRARPPTPQRAGILGQIRRSVRWARAALADFRP